MTKYFILNNSVKIPNIGYGTWRVPESSLCVDLVKKSLECGYRHIDTAFIYENEGSVGLAIKQSSVKREDIFVTSKLWNDFRGFNETIEQCERSLKRLGLDYLDLYLIHWPIPNRFKENWEESNAESWRAFERLYRDGKLRSIGVSNFLPHHLDVLLKTAEIVPMVNQIELHPGLNREKEVEYNQKHEILTEAWAPFGVGKALEEKKVILMAEKYGKTAAQIVLRWLLQKGILPLPKSVTQERIVSNIDVYNFEIAEEDMLIIDSIAPHSLSTDPNNIDF